MEFAAMATMRLKSRTRQFGGFTHGGRVFGRAPEMPIGAVGNPHFEDFTNPVGAPAAKTHHLLWAIQQIRQASLTAYFSGELNLAFRSEFESPKMKVF